MEERLIFTRETVSISGGRRLYSYTFREATPLDQLIQMIETGEIGVVGPFLDQHPGLELDAALSLARECGNGDAVREIEQRG